MNSNKKPRPYLVGKHVEKQNQNDIYSQYTPEFTLLSVNIPFNFGALDTIGIINTIDVFNVSRSGERRR